MGAENKNKIVKRMDGILQSVDKQHQLTIVSDKELAIKNQGKNDLVIGNKYSDFKFDTKTEIADNIKQNEQELKFLNEITELRKNVLEEVRQITENNAFENTKTGKAIEVLKKIGKVDILKIFVNKNKDKADI
jgi:hypothetical protein